MKIILPLNYRYVCKIHSKKSLHREDGDKWRNHLIQSLMGSKHRINKAKKMLDDNAGIVVAKGNVFKYSEWIGSNKDMIKSFSKKTSINLPKDFTFPAGSMFWFKPDIMRPLVENFDDSLLPFEDGQIDGTKAHAVERLFGLLCFNKSLSIEVL
jgi:lipopolysaccharide biosynthesis protein